MLRSTARRLATAVATAISALNGFQPSSAADTVADFYARLLTRHMGRHIPGNPNIVPQNMLGASGINGANLLFNISPKDGSAIGTFAHTVPLDPLIGQGVAKFDASKFNYLGNMEESIGVCAIWHEAGIASLADLQKVDGVSAGLAKKIFDYFRG